MSVGVEEQVESTSKRITSSVVLDSVVPNLRGLELERHTRENRVDVSTVVLTADRTEVNVPLPQDAVVLVVVEVAELVRSVERSIVDTLKSRGGRSGGVDTDKKCGDPDVLDTTPSTDEAFVRGASTDVPVELKTKLTKDGMNNNAITITIVVTIALSNVRKRDSSEGIGRSDRTTGVGVLQVELSDLLFVQVLRQAKRPRSSASSARTAPEAPAAEPTTTHSAINDEIYGEICDVGYDDEICGAKSYKYVARDSAFVVHDDQKIGDFVKIASANQRLRCQPSRQMRCGTKARLISHLT